MTNTSRVEHGGHRNRTVDVHAHAVPADLLAELGAAGGPSALPELGSDQRIRFGARVTPPVGAALADVRARLAEMDRTGVDIQVISPWMELAPDELDRRAASAFLRLLNDGMAEIASARPDRFRALALVDRRAPAEAETELVRTAGRAGMVGVELAAGGPGPALHERAWDRLWAAATECRSFVLLHPWRARSTAGFAEPRLGDIVDNPAQSTSAVGAMALTGVFDRFPDLRLCVVHGGGFLPYQAGRFDALARLASSRHGPVRPPSAVFRRLYYDSLTHTAESLRWLVEFAGSGRVLLGSDFPFPTGDAAAVRTVAGARALTPAERAGVLGGNACRLLGC